MPALSLPITHHASLAHAQVALAGEADAAALRAWAAHVDAGRIGGGAAPPPQGEHGLASLEAILGLGRQAGEAA